MKISAFPKCYMDDLCVTRTMSVFDWIEQAKTLGVEGLEMYPGFFTSFEDAYLTQVSEALDAAGFVMPLLCCSPDFTQPSPDGRKQAIEQHIDMIRLARRLGGAGTVCRILTGQRHPEVSREQGITWVVEAFQQLIPVAQEYDIILGLENHYKDGYWKYPEFAQQQDVFLEILAAIPEHSHFGVQYDPSNALVAGDDPLEMLNHVVNRVVSMHASDRFLFPGATLADLKQHDGTAGYAAILQHGVIGKGMNDYDTIFRILSASGYRGWVSIEDGMNGLDEIRQSAEFLKTMRSKYFGENLDASTDQK
jgi:sugar phosphate isomerase/epimerase